MRFTLRHLLYAILLLAASSGSVQAKSVQWKKVDVTATAYNSLASQTSTKKPMLAAWGDILKPGMKAIAVSRDLVRRGLTRGTRVKIEGLKGVYVVLDKMSSRWHRRIDIFMGKNVEAARDWGHRQDIQIRFADTD